MAAGGEGRAFQEFVSTREERPRREGGRRRRPVNNLSLPSRLSPRASNMPNEDRPRRSRSLNLVDAAPDRPGRRNNADGDRTHYRNSRVAGMPLQGDGNANMRFAMRLPPRPLPRPPPPQVIAEPHYHPPRRTFWQHLFALLKMMVKHPGAGFVVLFAFGVFCKLVSEQISFIDNFFQVMNGYVFAPDFTIAAHVMSQKFADLQRMFPKQDEQVWHTMKQRFGCHNPFVIYGVGGDAKMFAERTKRLTGKGGDSSKKGKKKKKKEAATKAGLRDGTLVMLMAGPHPTETITTECISEKVAHTLFYALGSARPLNRVQVESELPKMCQPDKLDMCVGPTFHSWLEDFIAGGADQACLRKRCTVDFKQLNSAQQEERLLGNVLGLIGEQRIVALKGVENLSYNGFKKLLEAATFRPPTPSINHPRRKKSKGILGREKDKNKESLIKRRRAIVLMSLTVPQGHEDILEGLPQDAMASYIAANWKEALSSEQEATEMNKKYAPFLALVNSESQETLDQLCGEHYSHRSWMKFSSLAAPYRHE